MTPLLDPRARHQTREVVRQAEASAPVAKLVRGGKGMVNAGVIASILPHAEPRHLRALAADLIAEARRREG